VLGYDVVGESTDVHALIESGGSGGKLPKATVTGKAGPVIDSQHTRPLFDALGICRLQMMELGFEVKHYQALYQVITGINKTWSDMIDISERIWHLTRSFNVREIKDFGRDYDYPPVRFMEEPVPSGPNEGHCLTRAEVDVLLDEYYTARGWDQNGIPTKETLKRVGLEEIAAAMEAKRNF